MAVGEQRRDEPAFVCEPEPAAEASRGDLECGQEPAFPPQLDPGLDWLLRGEPMDGDSPFPQIYLVHHAREIKSRHTRLDSADQFEV